MKNALPVKKPSVKLLVFVLLTMLFESTMAQQQVKGKVTSLLDGIGLPGVNVLIKGTTQGAVTDAEGNYSITVNSGEDVLIFSYIGYVSEEEVVGDRSTINISMAEDLEKLKEVVVIGYGTTDRKELAGAVGSIDASKIQEANKVSPLQALQGQVAGVDIQAAGNKPGEPFNVRIRGASTINSNESIGNGGFSPGQNPLFVVDGIFVNDISFLNPSDIERMDVLKDAASTSIYGSRGSNGVVIISTKKGKKGSRMNVSYESYYGVREAYNLPDIFEGADFVDFFIDAAVGVQHSAGNFDFGRDDVVLSDFLRSNEIENINNDNYTDWVDLILQNGFQTKHDLRVTGGTENLGYNFSVGYIKDEGTFPGEDLDRYTLSGSIDADLSPKFKIAFSSYATFGLRDEGSREGFRSAYRLRPTGTPFEDDGTLRFFPLEGETFITNPLFEEANITRETRSLNFIGSLALTFKPVEDLSITSSFSPNIDFNRYGEYRGLFSKSVSNRQNRTRAQVDNRNRLAYTWDNVVNYNFNLGDEHSFKTTLISSTFLDREESYSTQTRDHSTDLFLFYNIGTGAEIRTPSSGLRKLTLQSFTGRVGYSFQNKYLFTLTGRYDGASILADGNKWAFFPSAAFAWRIADEGFMQGQNAFSELKLRISYGETGNNGTGGGLQPLGSQSLLRNEFTNFGDTPIRTIGFENLANQELEWERTSEINFGIDFGLLKNRIYGSVDLYSRNSDGIIFERRLPRVTGFGGVFDNIGEVRNRGIELLINSVNVDNGVFKWTTSLNFTRNTNEVLHLIDDVEDLRFSVREADLIHRVGEEIGSIFFYEFDGIWQTDEADEALGFNQRPGQVRVKDLNGDGQITDDDRTIIGSVNPDWTGGITNTVNYKNFDFTIFINTRQGAKEYSWFHRSHGWDADERPARFNGLDTDYWTPDNPINDWWQPGNAGPWKKTLFYQDVSFVKVGYITLGYNFSQQFINKLKLGGLRVYFTAQNPFIFTSYEGWDPETASRNSWGSAYLSRTLIGGLNVNF